MKHSRFFYAVALAIAPQFCIAQQQVVISSLEKLRSVTAVSGPESIAPKASVATTPFVLSEKIDRWVDVKELSFSSRYRSEKASDDVAVFANGQQRILVDGRVKADAAGRYTLNFHLSSGRTFNWAYADVMNSSFSPRILSPSAIAALPLPVLEKLGESLAAGYALPDTPSRGWEMSPRRLYLSATPVQWLTAEYGSVDIERGKSSEITTYDDDGYLTGERVRLRAPKHLYFDEIAVTYAYEGDIYKPNFIDRTQHLKKSNYHQFLFVKNFGKRLGASTDYTFDKKTHTIREAAYIKMPETKVLDALRVEFYQRLNTVQIGPFPLSRGSGLAVTADKTLFNRLRLDGGYEQVDVHYGATVDGVVLAMSGFSMNGDSYSTGKHVFTHANVKLTPYASLSGFYIHQTEAQPSGEFGFAKEGFNGGLNIDLKNLVNSKEKVF